MKAAVVFAGLLVLSCRPETPAAQNDKPLLTVIPGDTWIYQVHLRIPAGVTSATAAAVDTRFQRVRTYLGKRSAADGLPATDCFEVTVPGFPAEREFVEIRADRILMRGSLILRPESTKPMWLETPVPFVIADMKPGDLFPEVKSTAAGLSRQTEVLAHEDITVPAGAFRCIHLLSTGTDGELQLSRHVWFAPGHGIVREEKTRLYHGREIFRETQELVSQNKE